VSIPKTTPARIQIQEVSPQVDCGRYPVKRTVGDNVEVTARIFRDGHETLGAAIRHKGPDATRWSEMPLEPLGNDVWAGSFVVDRPGLWSFRIEAWVDRVASFQEELRRKVAAGQADLTSELSEGAVLLDDEGLTVETALAAPAGTRSEKAWSATYSVDADRVLGRFGSWYELFPRSWGGFAGVRKLLPQFAELGFDVLYLPPIHPIGHTNRKGRNNAETAAKGDVGSPWAIGSEEGGHDAIDPSLAPRRSSAPSSPTRRGSGSRSRSTSRSSARRTIPG
jgi:starch synthase (maltosyl-transferring)